jgi:hypothetical protein
MLFTRLGSFFAVLAMLLGASQVVLGIGIENDWQLPYADMLKDYSEGTTSAEVIDNGIYKVLFGLAFGILAEISRAVRDDL